jgi:hypothetical protein
MTRPPGRAIFAGVRAYRAEDWRKIREGGKRAFLLRHGFLGRGLPLGVVTALVIELALGGELPDALTTASFAGRLALAVGIFTLTGSLAANANWNLHERRFGGGAGR